MKTKHIDLSTVAICFAKCKCFFCGAIGHHTGYLPTVGAVWLCKRRCEDRYSMARIKLCEDRPGGV